MKMIFKHSVLFHTLLFVYGLEWENSENEIEKVDPN